MRSLDKAFTRPKGRGTVNSVRKRIARNDDSHRRRAKEESEIPRDTGRNKNTSRRAGCRTKNACTTTHAGVTERIWRERTQRHPAEVHQLQQQFSQLEKSHKEYTDLLRDQERFKGELRGVIGNEYKGIGGRKRSINTLQHQLQDQLHQSEFKTLEEVIQLLSEPINIEEGKQTVDLFKEQLLRVQTSLEQLTREIGDRKYDSNHHEEVVTTIELLKKKMTSWIKSMGK